MRHRKDPSMTDVTASSPSAVELRDKLVNELVAQHVIQTKEVEAAFREVPRHLFAPEAPLEKAYAQTHLATKRDDHGITISSVSAPEIQATMLEQAGLRPGHRCLEIGSGGYNAALMASLVGENGEVTTIDIDGDVTDRALACLKNAGYPRVNVVRTDGEDGCAEHAPYDRTIVTVGSWDIPPAWVEQLADGGTITVPLRCGA